MKKYSGHSKKGFITLDQDFLKYPTITEGHLGIEVNSDGRVWICIEGITVLRFKPSITKDAAKMARGETKKDDGYNELFGILAGEDDAG